MSPRTFILMGKSGSGKGTQGKLLQEYLESNDSRKILYAETGQSFRDFAKRDNYSAIKVKKMLNKGQLMPAFLSIWIWSQFIIDNFTGEEHMIFDGLSRRLEEAKILDTALQFCSDTKADVIHVDVSRDWARERLMARGRADDNESDINERLDWFEKDVAPVIDFYRADTGHFNFHNIGGEQTIKEVHEELVNTLF